MTLNELSVDDVGSCPESTETRLVFASVGVSGAQGSDADHVGSSSTAAHDGTLSDAECESCGDAARIGAGRGYCGGAAATGLL
jgi:hypothetical protein